ncbi:MAG: cation-translocating P-type ATPase [Candidatus Hydrogenedentes bacterium]|nr:cation-translocating P-type ATPase [Candidatus Hydrogenedentota bacterium]
MGTRQRSGCRGAIRLARSLGFAWGMAAFFVMMPLWTAQMPPVVRTGVWATAQLLMLLGLGIALGGPALADLRRRRFTETTLVAGPVLLILVGALVGGLGMSGASLMIAVVITAAIHLTQQRMYQPFERLVVPERPAYEGVPENEPEAPPETDAAEETADRKKSALSPVEKAVRALGWTGLILVALTLALWLALPSYRVFCGEWARRLGRLAPADMSPVLYQGLLSAFAVLAVMSPFALRTASPLVTEAALEAGAARRVRYRDGEAVRSLGEATMVVFAAPGALTEGCARVRAVETMGVSPVRDVLAYAGAATSGGGDMFADAVRAACRRENIDVTGTVKVSILPGLGVQAQVGERTVLAGRPRLLREQEVDFGAFEDTVARFQTAGLLVRLVAVDGRCLGVIALHDPLRRDSVRVTKMLRALGIRTALLAGEDKLWASVTAEQAGVDDVVADVLPADRSHALAQLRSETIGKMVLVSASEEDATVWRYADAGIALCACPEAAPPEVSAAISHEQLIAVVRAVVLARESLLRTVENAAWLTAYHGAMTPLAMLGLVHPAAGAALSTLAWVVTRWNARRLLRFDPDARVRKILARRNRGDLF